MNPVTTYLVFGAFSTALQLAFVGVSAAVAAFGANLGWRLGNKAFAKKASVRPDGTTS